MLFVRLEMADYLFQVLSFLEDCLTFFNFLFDFLRHPLSLFCDHPNYKFQIIKICLISLNSND